MVSGLRPAFGMALLLGSALALSQCGGGSPTSPQRPTPPVVDLPPTTPPVANPDPNPIELPTQPPVIPTPGNATAFINVLGDTGWCGSPALRPLSLLFERFDGDILLAGDLAYPSGTMDEFRNCFEPSFGRFKTRMRASPGNHDYVASVSATSYFDYFGERAGPSRRGFYAFKAGEWTVLMLNSNDKIQRGSDQYNFVRTTMQQSPTRCTMAVMHHPFDSSGINGPTPSLRDIWELMYNLGGDLVIAGHDHLYERFTPVNADQRKDEPKGIRQFTVGTGGAPLYNKVRNSLNSEFLVSNFGMLRLKLEPAFYSWQFMDMNGNVLDPGLNVCH